MLPRRPDDGPSPYDYQTPLMQFLDYVSWIVLVICGMATLVVAGRLAMSYRNGDPEREVLGLVWVLAAVVLCGSASAVVNELLK